MSKRFDSRILSVYSSRKGRAEELTFHLAAGSQPPHPAPHSRQIHSQTLQADIAAVDTVVKRLLSLRGGPRGEVEVEAAARSLHNGAFPEGGLHRILELASRGGAGPIDPQVGTSSDIATKIPWEAIEELFYLCPLCCASEPFAATVPFCRSCGKLMERAGGKLVESHSLSHHVFGSGPPTGSGQDFLLVIDPTEDLINPDDPDDSCELHVSRLRELLKSGGFAVRQLRGSQVTLTSLREHLGDPNIGGIYYFGHGRAPQKDEAHLILHGDQRLYADDVKRIGCPARLVFLNACEAASANAGEDGGVSSVAQAFACGNRVVIAPTYRVLDSHAAAMAITFFEAAMDRLPLGEAIMLARRESLEKYRAGEAHISWLAYRYFGDPNLTVTQSEDGQRRWISSSGHIVPEAFGFPIAEVLRCADERRSGQNRKRLSVTDLIAGLLKTGNLTREFLSKEGTDRDDMFAALLQRHEADQGLPPETPGPFTDQLFGLLDHVSEKTLETISELDVLLCLTEDGVWPSGVIGLPTASRLRRRLTQFQESAAAQRPGFGYDTQPGGPPKEESPLPSEGTSFQMDSNGTLSFPFLDEASRRILDTAHVLSQQRGTGEIGNRLLMAAFVADPKGFCGRVCTVVGLDPSALFALMIATLHQDDGTQMAPRVFNLSLDVCSRVVLPVLAKARSLTPGEALVGEREVFRAFCALAPVSFKQMLLGLSRDEDISKLLGGEVDLDDLAMLDPAFCQDLFERLDSSASLVIRNARGLAGRVGASPIPNRLVLAAFLNDDNGPLVPLLAARGISRDVLAGYLTATTGTGPHADVPLDQASSTRAIIPMVMAARSLVPDVITSRELFRAFAKVVPVELKDALLPLRIDLELLAAELERDGASPATQTSPSMWDPGPFLAGQFDAPVWVMLESAAQLAKQHSSGQIRTPHLFSALFMAAAANSPGPPPSPDGIVRLSDNATRILMQAQKLAQANGRANVGFHELLAVFATDSGGLLPDLMATLSRGTVEVPAPSNSPGARSGASVLSAFGTDLTAKASRGELPAIVGRETEIHTLVQNLIFSENPNPLLVGEAGVGKTAIVEGLALQMAAGKWPQLAGKRLVELSVGSLVANTRLRGEFEERIQQVLAEAGKDVILFIDEIHTIVGAGAAEGSGPDAGNMLKTALSKGEIRLIGATTHNEFKRTIERDRALARRFQVQIILSPSRDATVTILTARRPALESHHSVSIGDDAIAAAVDLSGRYLVEKQWPAKARDVLERACALVVTSPPATDGLAVSADDVAKVVGRLTGVPVERLSAGDVASLISIEERLNRRIFGQEAAVHSISEAVQRGRFGMASVNRPWGVFLLAGPPGVGKTSLAKALSEEVFGGSGGLIRFDMGDFTEAHSALRLTGAPPSYVGYGQGTPLVEQLRRRPYSVVLFDEIEQAHPNVLAVLLRLLSEGTIADVEGNIADVRNCIVVFTSNLLGATPEGRRIGFAPETAATGDSRLRALLADRLSPQFIDRVDAIVCFQPLSRTACESLLHRELESRTGRVAELERIRIRFAPEVVPWLADRIEPGECGRSAQRVVDQYVTPALTAALAAGVLADSRVFLVRVRPDETGLEADWEVNPPQSD